MRVLTQSALIAALAVGACTTPDGQTSGSTPPSAGTPTPPSTATGVPTTATRPPPVVIPTRQVVVVLAAAERPRWGQIQSDLGARHQLRNLRSFPLQSIDVQCLIYEVPEDRPLDDVVQRLRSDPRVDDAQPNRPFEGLVTSSGAAGGAATSDPYARLQWGNQVLGLDALPRPASGRGVTVAVVDTGADTHHPDLGPRVVQHEDLVKTEGDPFDADQHGTAVAGVISAVAGNRTGIAGVAPDARLMLLKACRQGANDKAKCLSWTIARGIDAAIVGQARVINLSLSGPPDPLIARLIRKADERGIVVVAAAQADQPSFPASMAEVVGVMASDASGRIATPQWPKAEGLVAAPGIEIITTVPGARYDFLSGSSLSSAYVSGVVAVLLELAPATTPQAMRMALLHRAGATPSPVDAADVLRALALANGQ